MKTNALKTSGSFLSQRELQRERRYPILTAIDLLLHWLLSGAAVLALGTVLALIVTKLLPLAVRFLGH